MAGCGLPFTYLAVRPDAVDHAVPDQAALDALGVGEGVSVLSWDAATSTAYARVFAGDLRWDEDPATGSAALGTRRLAGRHRPAAGGEGTSSYVVRQGEKMGRPSVLTCTVTASGGTAVSATVQRRRRADRGAAASACPRESTHRLASGPGRCTARARGTSACSPSPSSASRSRRR